VVPADSRRFARSRRYLGARNRGCVCFGYGAVTHYGRSFQDHSPTQQLGNSVEGLVPFRSGPTTPRQQRHQAWHCHGLVSTLFARRYSGCRGCFPFLTVLRCFNSRGSLHRPYVFRPGYHSMTSGGFPHSDICGSRPSRRLPAAFRSHSRPSSVLGAKASTVGSS
jgi:hypothetical protein